MRKSRAGLMGALALGVGLAAFTMGMDAARAFTSVEGSTLGDQGYYWGFAQEAWIFPHRTSNIDERAMFQLNDEATTLTGSRIINGNTLSSDYYNILPVQTADGGGLVVNIIENLDVGIWFAENHGPGFGASGGGFINRGVNSLGWLHGNSTTINELAAFDAGEGVDGETLDAMRKIDLFASYLLPELDLETGLHLWWGSNNSILEPDNSVGPINIDTDSDPTDPAGPLATSEAQAVQESKYRLTDFGIGLGAGYTGVEDLRVDVGLDLNLLGVTWTPNDLNNYVDAGGSGVALNLRGHYQLRDDLQVGGFVRVATSSMSLEPKRQRDGGDLKPFFDQENPGLPNPPGGAPTGEPPPGSVGDELAPVRGIKYSESKADMQLAALARYEPNSRAIIYASLGVARLSASEKIEVGNDWLDEVRGRLVAAPFIQLGVTGVVTDWLDIFLGASKRWQQWTQEVEAFDSRIPDDGNQGATGAPPPVGDEDNTNANRRRIEARQGGDRSTTHTNIGARFHVDAFQFVTQIDPDALLSGPYFLFGESTTNPLFWFSIIYDWDFDQDQNGGNGEMRISPHLAQAGAENGGMTQPGTNQGGGMSSPPQHDSLGHEVQENGAETDSGMQESAPVADPVMQDG